AVLFRRRGRRGDLRDGPRGGGDVGDLGGPDLDGVAVGEQVLLGGAPIDGEGQPQRGQAVATLDGGEDQAPLAQRRIVEADLVGRLAADAGDRADQGRLGGGPGSGREEEEVGHAIPRRGAPRL